MCKLRNATLLSALGVAVLVVLSCDRTPTPVSPQANRPNFSDACGGSNPCPAPNFRMTGGGRVDAPRFGPGGTGSPHPNDYTIDPACAPSKSWATFGFNARLGKGQVEWNDHCSGTRIHGYDVTSFVPLTDPDGDPQTGKSGVCATFSGPAKVNGVDDGSTYTVDACDRQEPGVRHDEIRMTLTNAGGTQTYQRGPSVLSGGNIQAHPTH